jgi:hypothetical protein
METVEYKHIHSLPFEYQHAIKNTFPIVVAVQERIEKRDYEIGLHNLIMFFKERKLIQEQTAKEILEINDVRNTFHFSKTRSKPCDITQVEKALQLLVRTIERAPSALSKK